MVAPFEHVVTTADQLRALYRAPSRTVQRKKTDRMDDATQRFIQASPFLLMATSAADGSCDVSPRGGPPGFVRVLDDRRLVIPDLSGNNLLDSLVNLTTNPHLGLLFLIPGRDETLRVDGGAWITTAPRILALWDGELRQPKTAVGVEVEHAFVHCAKSFRRGRVWDAESWAEVGLAPDACDLLIAHIGLDAEANDIRASLEESYRRDLAADSVQS
jgi:PPOX class probable FMN-dependent enzyme